MTRKQSARPARTDIYTSITDRIIADLATGTAPWRRPWTTGNPGPVSRPLRHSGEAYNGINTLLLWSEAMASGYSSPTWMTFRQALALGAHVRKDERGTTIIYADRITRSDTDDDGQDVARQIPFLKAYSVFNCDQIEDLPERYHAPQAILDDADRNANAEAFFAATGIEIRHHGDHACYIPALDRIELPPFGAFRSPNDYYATLAHEAGHATGHSARLNRDFSGKFGSSAYAREELVAELCAAFLCADLGLSLEPRPDHASYIATWIEVLGREPKFIVAAAAHAQRAADWLTARQGSG